MLRERSGVEIKGKTMDIVLFCLNSNSQYNIGAARVACPICFVLRPVSHPCAHRRSKCCVFGWKFKLIRTVIVIFFLYIYMYVCICVYVCVCVFFFAPESIFIFYSPRMALKPRRQSVKLRQPLLYIHWVILM